MRFPLKHYGSRFPSGYTVAVSPIHCPVHDSYTFINWNWLADCSAGKLMYVCVVCSQNGIFKFVSINNMLTVANANNSCKIRNHVMKFIAKVDFPRCLKEYPDLKSTFYFLDGKTIKIVFANCVFCVNTV